LHPEERARDQRLKEIVMIENLAALRARFIDKPVSSFYRFDEGDPRRLNPLSLEQQRKRAKERLREWRSAAEPGQPIAKLSDAQHIIANEQGFKNWAQMKAHIEQSLIARDALGSGEPGALDGHEKVLHIRCGTDIMQALAIAGFCGDFLAFFDPYVEGPVPSTDSLEEFLQIRAGYIGGALHPNQSEVLNDLRQQYADLERVRDYDKVCIWLEHDSYDQLILAKLLDFFSDRSRRPASLKLISVTHYPGVKRFNSLGDLPPLAMRVLWESFSEVTPGQIALGQRAWAALRSETPKALRAIIATATPELPTLAIALARHLRQLPSQRNGLNLSQSLALQVLADKGDMNAARLFGWYTNHYEPLVFMGDSSFWHMLSDLSNAAHPAIALDKQGEKPNQWQVKLSETGRQLLAGEVDWVELNGIDRWLGGIRLKSGKGEVFRSDDE
jgi:hypothetical protein